VVCRINLHIWRGDCFPEEHTCACVKVQAGQAGRKNTGLRTCTCGTGAGNDTSQEIPNFEKALPKVREGIDFVNIRPIMKMHSVLPCRRKTSRETLIQAADILSAAIYLVKVTRQESDK
jgi:hypothetical protein